MMEKKRFHTKLVIMALHGNGQAIMFYSCGFFFFFVSSFFPHLFSAVGDWMSTMLPHMVWP